MRMVAVPLVACLLLTGCTSSQTFEDGEFEVQLTGSPLGPGGRATFDVTFTLEKPLTYTHPGCGPDLFSATVEIGDGIHLGEYGASPMFGTCAVREQTLPAGSHTATFHWNGHEGTMDDGAPHDGDRVPAGTYDVVIELRGDADKSTTVQVEVR